MTSREITQLLVNVAQVTNFTKSLNINKEAIITHTATLKVVQTKLDGYTTKYQDENYRKTLSIPEQRVLMDNAKNLYEVHEQLRKELDYLDMSKITSFVSHAINELEHAFLLIEWFQESIGKNGEIILPHLTCIREKTWNEGKYKNKIDSLYLELEAISYDFYQDHVKNDGFTPSDPRILIPIADRASQSSLLPIPYIFKNQHNSKIVF
jgi:hypothetical protein